MDQIHDYNSTRPKLLMTEYGRNVQNMIDHLLTIEDRSERNKFAQAVINLMGQLNPHLRDVVDFQHKLWDHLFIISDFKLDVDSPYPVPSKKTLISKPEKINYPTNNIKYKHYGKTLEMMIAKVSSVDDIEFKKQSLKSLMSFMKMSYSCWNKDYTTDEVIFENIIELSNNKITIDDLQSISSNNYSSYRNFRKADNSSIRNNNSGSDNSSSRNNDRIQRSDYSRQDNQRTTRDNHRSFSNNDNTLRQNSSNHYNRNNNSTSTGYNNSRNNNGQNRRPRINNEQ